MSNGLKVQINNYDSYQSPPSCLDNLAPFVDHVPVIRIYGALVFSQDSTKYGFNTLLHVHNVYPYVYISCNYEYLKTVDETSHITELTNFLEMALKTSFRQKKDQEDPEIGENPGKRHYIAKVSLCKAVPIYGYRVGYRLFYKISFLSPLYKSRFANLFNAKTITIPFTKGQFKFEIFEAHVPYISQFLADFNLFSCNWIQFKTMFLRYPIMGSIPDKSHVLQLYLLHHIHNNVLNLNLERMGKSVLEMDIKLSYILNRTSISESSWNSNLLLMNLPIASDGLVSIEDIIKELKFQKHQLSVDFEFNPNIMSTNDDDANTIWTNDEELTQLLDYARKLTYSVKDSSIKQYNDTFFEKLNLKLMKYPTAFRLVDIEKLYMNLNILTSDLYSYNDVNELFVEQVSFRDLSVHQDSNDGAEDDDSARETDRISDSGSESEVDDIDSKQNANGNEVNENDEHDDNDPFQETRDAPNDLNDYDVTFNSFNDSQIFAATQHQQKEPQTQPQGALQEGLSKTAIIADLEASGIVKIDYPDPFYQNQMDMPVKPLIFANKKIKVPVKTDIPYLPGLMSEKLKEMIAKSPKLAPGTWEYATPPPLKQEIVTSFAKEQHQYNKRLKYKSQLEINSKSNEFKHSLNSTVDKRPDEYLQLTMLYMELHVNTNTNKLPNPATDEISVMFYKFADPNNMFAGQKLGVMVNKHGFRNLCQLNLSKFEREIPGAKISIYNDETNMVNHFLEMVEDFDPDIISGFEINAMSWGYLVNRFQKKMDISLLPQLSRSKSKNTGKYGDRWGYTHTSNITIVGRYTMNLWRVLRKEVTLNNYSFENCCYHISHCTFPKLENLQLSRLFNSNYSDFSIAISHYIKKVNMLDFFVDSLDLIDKNVELSRLVGVDFNSNFYRGSQFKVESILTRLSRSQNFILNSPSKDHVHKMRPLEQIPLIMEPNLNFYKLPLVVLDFQSLYPSIIIAYNLCYSTFLCRLHQFKPGKNPVGYINHMNLPPMILDFLMKHKGVTVTPNGMVFVKRHVRKSVLATMLQEILTLRINIKKFLGFFHRSEHPQLNKVFNSRQLALKLIANVTYGYTSATFSGRMPNSDIADAIVSCGRDILTQSINMIEQSEFGCKVVYGDTDSLFVYFPGKLKDEAFDYGQILADRISNKFPDPVKLKFEKVYHPSVLLSKKRYVGYNYEYKSQEIPRFEAKGIETIRRDGIPAQQKIVEKSLKILFNTSNLSSVKKYVIGEFNKILNNKVVIKDFCFAKEVRYGTYKNEVYLPPGAIVARKKIENDERSEPQYRERVPYVVYQDHTKIRLKDRCVSPEEFVATLSTANPMRLDYEYYIMKVLIPPLERIFNLMGVDIKLWYKEMAKDVKQAPVEDKTSITRFISKTVCINCRKPTTTGLLCNGCEKLKSEIGLSRQQDILYLQTKLSALENQCRLCVGARGKHVYYRCVNQDCVTYFDRVKCESELKTAESTADAVFAVD